MPRTKRERLLSRCGERLGIDDMVRRGDFVAELLDGQEDFLVHYALQEGVGSGAGFVRVHPARLKFTFGRNVPGVTEDSFDLRHADLEVGKDPSFVSLPPHSRIYRLGTDVSLAEKETVIMRYARALPGIDFSEGTYIPLYRHGERLFRLAGHLSTYSVG